MLCGKMAKFFPLCPRTKNPQTKNRKFKGVPGTLRRRDYRHSNKNGFDSPPLDPNRGSRGRLPVPTKTLRFGRKEKYNNSFDVIDTWRNSRKTWMDLISHDSKDVRKALKVNLSNTSNILLAMDRKKVPHTLATSQ